MNMIYDNRQRPADLRAESDPARRVVITGIGMVAPIGIGVDTVWENLLAGASGVGPIEGFDASRLPVRIAGEVRDFDPGTWMDVRESRRLDRFCQFVVAASDLATEGGALRGADRDRTATFIGSAIGGAATIQEAVVTGIDRPRMVSPFFVPNSMANMGAATIARRHGLRGPSGAAVTACASSADAVGQAFRLVKDGYAAACVTGGAEACIVGPIVAGFANMRALSRRNDDPTRAARPFAADRDGFVIAEGATVLVLETAAAAMDRGAHVYAEICGFGQTNDAHHMTAPAPDGEGAARAMRAALAEAGLATDEVDYINAHGTGTHLSDLMETAAVKQAFGDHSKRIAVSSTKSMTGHLLGAAGAAEAAFSALAIDRGWIPPTINHGLPDPGCDLDYVPNAARRQEVAVALTNSFAFGGHNTALALRRFIP